MTRRITFALRVLGMSSTNSTALGASGLPISRATHVVSSARKFRTYGVARVFAEMLKIGLRGLRGTRSPEGLGLWYDGMRESDDD